MPSPPRFRRPAAKALIDAVAILTAIVVLLIWARSLHRGDTFAWSDKRVGVFILETNRGQLYLRQEPYEAGGPIGFAHAAWNARRWETPFGASPAGWHPFSTFRLPATAGTRGIKVTRIALWVFLILATTIVLLNHRRAFTRPTRGFPVLPSATANSPPPPAGQSHETDL